MSAPDDAIAYCHQALPGVSRTFALGIELLQQPLRDEVGVAYLICRILDTIEDTTELPADRRAALLDRAAGELVDGARWPSCAEAIEAMFAPGSLAGADHDLCRHARTVLSVFHSFRPEAREAMRPSIQEMGRGMAATVRRELRGEGLHLETVEDLERYCYYVAGTVGHLLTNLFTLDREAIAGDAATRLRANAVSFGLGLQVTNIVKGVTDDIARGVSYVPSRLFEEARIDLDTLLENPADPRGREVVAGLVEMTLHWLDRALEYTLAIPASEPDIRLFCALPLTFAVRTLDLALRTTDVFSEQVLKITRDEVAAIHLRLVEAIRDDTALRAAYAAEKAPVVTRIRAARPLGQRAGG